MFTFVAQKLLLPRLKSWIRRVVAEGDEATELKAKLDEETREAVKASATAVSAIAQTNQELLASKDEGILNIASLFQVDYIIIRKKRLIT